MRDRCTSAFRLKTPARPNYDSKGKSNKPHVQPKDVPEAVDRVKTDRAEGGRWAYGHTGAGSEENRGAGKEHGVESAKEQEVSAVNSQESLAEDKEEATAEQGQGVVSEKEQAAI